MGATLSLFTDFRDMQVGVGDKNSKKSTASGKILPSSAHEKTGNFSPSAFLPQSMMHSSLVSGPLSHFNAYPYFVSKALVTCKTSKCFFPLVIIVLVLTQIVPKPECIHWFIQNGIALQMTISQDKMLMENRTADFEH